MVKPLISVGMPVFNGEKYIESAVESIRVQTLDNFELIISDNASIDNTEDICRKLAKEDSRIVYSKNKTNLGAAQNYNLLVHRSQGDYFRWHNADDLIEPEYHYRCYSTLEKHTDAVLAFGKTKIIDADGKLLQYYDDNLHNVGKNAADRFILFLENVGQTNAIYGLMRKEALLKTHLFRKFQASDTNFMGELVLYGKFIQIPEYFFSRRMHEDASSWDRNDNKIQKNFWDPKSTRFNYQTIKKHFAYYSDVITSDIDISEKVRILRYLLKTTWWARNNLLNDFMYSIRNKV